MANTPGNKKRPLYTPPAVQNRVMDQYVGGQSQREIAENEGIDRATVRRILSQKEFLDGFVLQRSRILSLADQATRVIEKALGSESEKVALSAAYKIIDAIATMDKGLSPDLTFSIEYDMDLSESSENKSVLGIPREPPRVVRAKPTASAHHRKT